MSHEYSPPGSTTPGAAYLSPQPQPQEQRAGWGLILGAAALALVLVGVVVKTLLPTDAQPAPQTSTNPLAAPERPGGQGGKTDAKGDHSAATAHGPGWVMDRPRQWQEIKVPAVREDAAWRTGGGASTTLTVIPEPVATPMTLESYVASSEMTLTVGISSVEIISSKTLHADGHRYGRIEYTVTVNGVGLHQVAYLVETSDGGFVVATLSATPGAFARASAKVEPYLETLQAS